MAIAGANAPQARLSALERYLETLPRQPLVDRQLWRDGRGQVQGQFFNCSLTSAFEPLVTLAEREVVAHEGAIHTYAQDASVWPHGAVRDGGR